jgi:hypothetical protein
VDKGAGSASFSVVHCGGANIIIRQPVSASQLPCTVDQSLQAALAASRSISDLAEALAISPGASTHSRTAASVSHLQFLPEMTPTPVVIAAAKAVSFESKFAEVPDESGFVDEEVTLRELAEIRQGLAQARKGLQGFSFQDPPSPTPWPLPASSHRPPGPRGKTLSGQSPEQNPTQSPPRYPLEQQENAGLAATSPNCPPPLGFPFGSYRWRGSKYSLDDEVSNARQAPT